MKYGEGQLQVWEVGREGELHRVTQSYMDHTDFEPSRGLPLSKAARPQPALVGQEAMVSECTIHK